MDLCGGTGSWSRPYAEAGYTVYVVDPLASRDELHPNQWPINTDVRLLRWDGDRARGILAAPPCTHLAVSGARWWAQKGEAALLESLSIVDACLRIISTSRPYFWALENPVGRLRAYLGPPELMFNPCDYGDPYTKKTLLWGDFQDPIRSPVEPTEGTKMHRLPPSPDRWRLRSKTPAGFARAFFEANP